MSVRELAAERVNVSLRAQALGVAGLKLRAYEALEALPVSEMGVGYASGTQSYFATLGVQDGTVRLGADITMETVTPNLELLTLSRRKAPSQGCSAEGYEPEEDEEEGGLVCTGGGGSIPIGLQPLQPVLLSDMQS